VSKDDLNCPPIECEHSPVTFVSDCCRKQAIALTTEEGWSGFWSCHGQVFPNLVREGSPTTRELADSANSDDFLLLMIGASYRSVGPSPGIAFLSGPGVPVL
jgi:hypothetical protein